MPQGQSDLALVKRLTEIGIALSAEKDAAKVLEMILLGAKELTHADGGTLYSVQDDRTVRMEILRTDSLHFSMGGTTGRPIPFPPIPLYDENDQPNTHMVVTYAVLNHTTVNIADAYDAQGFDFSGTRRFDQNTGYRSKSFLTVPLTNHVGDIIGVLQLLNAVDPATGEVIPFSDEAERLTESLASQAAITLTNRRLIAELKRLLESLIQLIASAIDEKSPYTGGHCRRVPALTLMLADAASQAESGPLSDFRMSEEDRYELEIAAWLHDCGKITTPEYVVDKATKLETIFDRIELVDTRFEVLRRDARIRLLEHRLAGDDEASAQAEYLAALARIDEDQGFLRSCNTGGEFMPDGDRERVRLIGERTWEQKGVLQPFLSPNEVYNLTIAKGTLTPEEREKINHHIVATIRMLESLPFPKHLRRVPEFAGGHHERMDGKGYPRGLKREQMSVQARAMAIADIFEALTAADRPYKRGKMLSESLRILALMKKDGHIDPDLFDIFLKERIFDRYAAEHMDPAQIDEVDVEKLPS